MLDQMDPVVVLFITGLVVIIGYVAGIAISRGRSIDRLADATGATDADDVEGRVREGLAEPSAARWTSEQVSHDTGYLTELLTAGIVRLRDDLVVEVANEAAHAILERRSGTMIGRSAPEAV